MVLSVLSSCWMAALTDLAAKSLLVCAPPVGSVMMPSTMPSSRSLSAVICRASAACGAKARSFQRIAAQPSGEITE